MIADLFKIRSNKEIDLFVGEYSAVFGSKSDKSTNSNQGVIPFATELAKYFMDFLETDFHKVRNPKRNIQTKNNNNLQILINLNKYKKLPSRSWKLISSGFNSDILNHIKKGEYTAPIPKSLLDLIAGQVSLIDSQEIEILVKKIQAEIDVGLSKFPKDTVEAITFAFDGARRILKDDFVNKFVERIREPFEKSQAGSVDSVFQLQDELSDILIRGLEDPISSVINHLSLGKDIDRLGLISQSLELADITNKLLSYFAGFSSGDLFSELVELTTNKNLLENQEFYFNFCDISFGGTTYPLFYIPIQLAKKNDGFDIVFESSVYVNKKAVQFISQQNASQADRRGSLTTFAERIIYLADEKDHFIGRVDGALKELVNHFGLIPHIDIQNPDRQVAKSSAISVSNSTFIGLFDKSDESLINDYEEILQKLSEGDDQIAKGFNKLVDEFISNNPISSTLTIENEWDKTEVQERLVYHSPVPLNEEQRQILNALKKPSCKYISVEGPPGTGKSHTITAIVCDAILNNQSVLVISDKKEALDVVEDKITQTLNKVRQDRDFQNPILRLGQAGNTYSKILSNASMERIKDHYKAVKNDFKNIESSIVEYTKDLKINVTETIAAYSAIELKELKEFYGLEDYFSKTSEFPIDIENDLLEINEIIRVRKTISEFNKRLNDSRYSILSILESIYGADTSVENLQNLLIYFDIARSLSSTNPEGVKFSKNISNLNVSSLECILEYVKRINSIKSGIFGTLFKSKEIIALNDELSKKVQHSISKPHSNIQELMAVVNLHTEAGRLKKKFEIELNFRSGGDFISQIHDLVTLTLSIPTQSDINVLKQSILDIQSFINTHEKIASRSLIYSGKVNSFGSNKISQITDADFSKFTRYLELRSNLERLFKSIPQQDYVSNKTKIESLVTTQMTFKMDERVVDFYENYRNDAKSLANVISKKQKFDRASFDKLKQSFPCILAGIRDYSEFIPLENDLFDLVIVDEASQVSIAQALPALLRGKKIVVLGDKKQFSNVKSSQARSDTNREYLNRLREVFLANISNDNVMMSRLEKFNIKTSVLEFSVASVKCCKF